MDNKLMSNIDEIHKVICESASMSVLKKAVLSKPSSSDVKRSVIIPKLISGKQMLCVETFLSDNKAIHKNIELSNASELKEMLAGYSQINVLTTAGDCEFRRSKSGNSTLIGVKNLLKSIYNSGNDKVELVGNDKKKSHILSGNEEFLKLLGVSDENGRVFDKKQSKFKQINRFLEHIRDIVKHLPKDKPLYMCDLCCGKSYLSFAAYHYLKNVLEYDVHAVAVDLKPDVIEYCSTVAEMLKFDTIKFVCGDITKFSPEFSPSLVISLHACDTATDIVIEKAIEWKSKVILSTPCCHHELNHTINCEALSFITEHSMLRQKLCDAATDALRLKLLEANGYSTEALELIDPEETPKNILLRAIKKSENPQKQAQAMKEYNQARKFLLGI